MCIESCNLLTKFSQEKHGTCPSTSSQPLTKSMDSSLPGNDEGKCANKSGLSISDSTHLTSCQKDSECADTSKCCALDPDCPQLGNACQRPRISANSHLPSVPFNLSIVERKKGKTIILSWDSNYNKNKPTLFVVEGRWSLNSPTSSSMTKWGYLAQTVNNNWIILRSINRGRW